VRCRTSSTAWSRYAADVALPQDDERLSQGRDGRGVVDDDDVVRSPWVEARPTHPLPVEACVALPPAHQVDGRDVAAQLRCTGRLPGLGDGQGDDRGGPLQDQPRGVAVLVRRGRHEHTKQPLGGEHGLGDQTVAADRHTVTTVADRLDDRRDRG
jgi:hypothetical protein